MELSASQSLPHPDPNHIYSFQAIPRAELYYSNETAFGVYAISTKEKLPYTNSYYEYDPVANVEEEMYHTKIAGKMQQLNIGTEYKIDAKLEYSRKYKTYQFCPTSVSQKVPKSLNEQRKFLQAILTSNQVDVLLAEYPNIVEDVVNGTDNVDLSKTKGIKDYYWNLIRGKILENYVISDLLTILSPLGISYNKIKKILGGESNPHLLKQKLLNDPYIIVEIPGISFKIADKIALKLNPNLIHSEKRIISFIKEYLTQLGEDEGHTIISIELLKSAIIENLAECHDLFEKVLESERESETFLYIENDLVGLSYYHFVEKEIWRFINTFNTADPLPITQEEIDGGIAKAEEDQGFCFTQEQKEILINATKNNLVILTGKAGVGKTTIARGLLNIYSNYNIGACALSAKAAGRITEVTKFYAMTIHRLLGANGTGFSFNETNQLFCDVVFLDESSMVYAGLFYFLLRAIRPTAKVILCGDSKQLPPIGYGNVFSDLLEKPYLQINYLTKIMRQAEKSGIIYDANLIREGINPIEKPSFKEVHGELQDLFYMFRDNREALNEIAIKTFMKSIEEVGLDNVFILTPRKKDCINSTREINRQIQDLLIDDNVPFVKYGDRKFKLGCRCIHTVNNYEKNVFNGEIGYISKVENVRGEEGGNILFVQYADKEIEYVKEEMDELDQAYALTTHKFQGSEAKIIISVIDNTHFVLLDTTYLYTTITRARERCLLLAEPFAFKKSIETNKSILRQTWLKYMN